MRFLLTRFVTFEAEHGDAKGVEKVSALAKAYVERAKGAAAEDEAAE
jgi:hypothetical protein